MNIMKSLTICLLAGCIMIGAVALGGFLNGAPPFSESDAVDFAQNVIGSNVVSVEDAVVDGRPGFVLELEENIEGTAYWVVTEGDSDTPRRKSPLYASNVIDQRLISLVEKK